MTKEVSALEMVSGQEERNRSNSPRVSQQFAAEPILQPSSLSNMGQQRGRKVDDEENRQSITFADEHGTQLVENYFVKGLHYSPGTNQRHPGGNVCCVIS